MQRARALEGAIGIPRLLSCSCAIICIIQHKIIIPKEKLRSYTVIRDGNCDNAAAKTRQILFIMGQKYELSSTRKKAKTAHRIWISNGACPSKFVLYNIDFTLFAAAYISNRELRRHSPTILSSTPKKWTSNQILWTQKTFL